MKQSNADTKGKLKNGIVTEYYKDGTVASVGKYSKGKKVGPWKYYLKNGVLRAFGKYSDGKIAGKWAWYRNNGKLMQTGSFEAGELKSGLWKRYHPNGMLYDEGKFSKGVKVGLSSTVGSEAWNSRDLKSRPH